MRGVKGKRKRKKFQVWQNICCKSLTHSKSFCYRFTIKSWRGFMKNYFWQPSDSLGHRSRVLRNDRCKRQFAAVKICCDANEIKFNRLKLVYMSNEPRIMQSEQIKKILQQHFTCLHRKNFWFVFILPNHRRFLSWIEFSFFNLKKRNINQKLQSSAGKKSFKSIKNINIRVQRKNSKYFSCFYAS
jgi:hypothetical protein